MEENRIKNQSQQPVTVMMVPQPVDEDEINLLDLWRTLVRRKRIVLAVAGMAVVAGLAYALLAPPVYKAEAFLLPPADKDVQGLNMQGLNMQGLNMQGLNMQITPEKVYQMAVRNLRSRSLRHRFFDANGLAKQMGAGAEDVEDVFEKGFNEKLKVERNKKRKAFVAIAFEGRDAGLAAQWVNDFLGLVQKEAVNTLVGDMRERIENAKRNLREGIAAKRKLARQRRLDLIAKLEEAIRIAAGIGLEENPLFMESKGVAKAVVTADQPLYMMGSKALKSEMEVLRARKSDDPFIKGLRELQERLAKLDGVEFNPALIKAFTLDQTAIPPTHRIKPKRKLIVLLALFGGLMLGVFAAFFAEFLGKARSEQAEALASE